MTKKTQQDVETAAKVLREAGAKEVFIFGSTAHGDERPDSDIDLAVQGLPPEAFFRARGKVTFAILRPFDLVDLDEENPFTDYLKTKGGLVRVA